MTKGLRKLTVLITALLIISTSIPAFTQVKISEDGSGPAGEKAKTTVTVKKVKRIKPKAVKPSVNTVPAKINAANIAEKTAVNGNPDVNTLKMAKAKAKKHKKDTVKTASDRSAVQTAKAAGISAAEPEQPAKKSDSTIYDLGNIVVKGEDKTKIKDKSQKKVTYVTKEFEGEAQTKKETATFTPAETRRVNVGEKLPQNEAVYQVMVGSNSSTESEGAITFYNGVSKSKLELKGEESGDYRYKSDYKNLLVNYYYEGEEEKNNTKIKAGFTNGNRNLPGFDNFINNYMDTDTRTYTLSGKYSNDYQRFEIGMNQLSKKLKNIGTEERYDSTLFNVGFAQDAVYANNPFTFELKLANDMLDIKTASSASSLSALFSVNAEKSFNDNFMMQFTPEVIKNGDNDSKFGGVVSAVIKENALTKDKNQINKYTLSAGRQARKYDTINFLFPDENTVVWAQDNLNKNRFDNNTYENDESFAEVSGEFGISENTKVKASYRNSKHDGLLYLTDLNSRDPRFTFNSFANAAKADRFKIEGEHKLNENFTIDAKAASTKITDSVNDLMPYIPKYEYSFGLNYKDANGFSGKISQNIKGDMDTSKNAAANAKVAEFSTLNLNLSKTFTENGKILFKVDNILDRDLKLRPDYSYKGRTFGLGFNYKY